METRNRQQYISPPTSQPVPLNVHTPPHLFGLLGMDSMKYWSNLKWPATAAHLHIPQPQLYLASRRCSPFDNVLPTVVCRFSTPPQAIIIIALLLLLMQMQITVIFLNDFFYSTDTGCPTIHHSERRRFITGRANTYWNCRSQPAIPLIIIIMLILIGKQQEKSIPRRVLSCMQEQDYSKLGC